MANIKISDLTEASVITDDDYIIVDNGTETRKAKVKSAINFPIGYIYMSVNSTNPASYFGGTWEQLENRFLLGAGTDYTAGDTGGEATVTLTTQQIPSHSHTYTDRHNNTTTNRITLSGDSNKYVNTTSGSYSTGNTGGGQAHNNMPPYLVVYMWKRTA